MERLGDHQADDGVAEELEALVVTRDLVRVLVQPRAVDQRSGEETRLLEREPESVGQLGRQPRRDPGLPRPRPGCRQLACSSM
jgi:hypothetical protein